MPALRRALNFDKHLRKPGSLRPLHSDVDALTVAGTSRIMPRAGERGAVPCLVRAALYVPRLMQASVFLRARCTSEPGKLALKM